MPFKLNPSTGLRKAFALRDELASATSSEEKHQRFIDAYAAPDNHVGLTDGLPGQWADESSHEADEESSDPGRPQVEAG